MNAVRSIRIGRLTMDIEAESVVNRCEAMGALENLGLYDLAEHLDTFKEAARTIRRLSKEVEALKRNVGRVVDLHE